MNFDITYKSYGESAILIEWPAKMNEDVLDDIISFNDKILSAKLDSIYELIQSINSLTVLYNHQMVTYTELTEWLDKLYRKKFIAKKGIRTLWKVPVCYDQEFGLDLQEISNNNGLSLDEIVNLHSGTSYLVYSIGFLPGFLYLGGLDQKLHIARKEQPRLEIVKGAIGIGGEQTGIYPTVSPGGWQIIGNTPIPLFELNKENPCFVKPGDQIQFYAISMTDHKLITHLISLDEYKLEQEVLND